MKLSPEMQASYGRQSRAPEATGVIGPKDIERLGAARLVKAYPYLVPGEAFYQKLLAEAKADPDKSAWRYPTNVSRDGTVKVR